MKKYTILVVDDTSENIDVLGELLSIDYNVKVAKKGAVAIKIVQKKSPD